MNIPHRKVVHHSADYWQKQITNWKRSGLTQSHFCQQNGLAISTFHKWQKKLRQDSNPELQLPEPFIELPTGTFNHSEPEKQWEIELSLGNGVTLRMRQA